MTIMDIIIKILLFFIVFYGAIMLTAIASKKVRESQTDKETPKNEEESEPKV